MLEQVPETQDAMQQKSSLTNFLSFRTDLEVRVLHPMALLWASQGPPSSAHRSFGTSSLPLQVLTVPKDLQGGSPCGL